MLILQSRYLIPKGFSGLTIFPFVIVSTKVDLSDKVLMNHERIHLKQQLELAILPFFVWYFVEYLLRLIQFRNRRKAYRNISFEREAYANEGNMEYLQKRKFWSFLKYL